MEAEWYENYGPDSATGAASGRSRRFIRSPPVDDEEDERMDQQRLSAEQILAQFEEEWYETYGPYLATDTPNGRSRRFAHPHEEDGNMDRWKSFTDQRPRFARSLTNQMLADLLMRHRLRHRQRQTKSPFPGQGRAAASDQA